MESSGPVRWSVEFYADLAGRCDVLEFISSLPIQEQATIKRSLELLQEFGLQLPTTYAKAITSHRKLWEPSVGGIRLFYVAHAGRTFVVRHGFRKKSMKTPVRDIMVAERRMAEFLSREGGDGP
jgi:phage-related protein